MAWAGAALLVGLTCVAYWPALHGDFIFDDEALISQSKVIALPHGLYRIWFTTEPQDYWPVTNTSFWLEWRLWGEDSTGYHCTNLALHIACSLLLWAVLRNLAVPGAYLAALLFALHPVNVESVAWIAQRKNLLALLFFLISLGSFLQTGLIEIARRKITKENIWYCLSLLAFVLSMLSKGSVAVFPFILLLLIWWKRRSIGVADGVRIAPFFVISILLTLLNIWFQTHIGKIDIIRLDFLQRCLGAGGVIWFYLAKAVVPVHLLFVYPQWDISAVNPLWWLPLLAALVVTGLLYWQRNSFFGRPLFVAWLFWCIALLPVMGFTDVGYMQHSRVADHYQHLALISVVALAAAGASYWQHHSHGLLNALAKLTPIVVVGVFTALTWLQSSLYANPRALYQATLKENPRSSLAIALLAGVEAKAGNTDAASEDFQQALQINPDYVDAHYALAQNLLEKSNQQKDRKWLKAALAQFQDAVRLKPDVADYRNDYAMALAADGQTDESLAQLEAGFRADPNHLGINFNLTNAYAHRQRWAEALALAKHALSLAQDEGNTEMIHNIEDQLRALNEILTPANPGTPPQADTPEDKASRP
ncbi:MAG TPA: tetratricopeptide repeat protein [Pirellulales bacterium]|nr:tetratricopeptide repeat protein [Pirellulales bacterium]